MEILPTKPEDRLGTEYTEHNIFARLNYYAEFYDYLAIAIMNWGTYGVQTFLNLDTYVYSSIKGTIESIHDILKKGRINDGYALLRKYYDSTIINIYANLYLSDHFTIDNFIVSQIDNWRKGTETIPEFRILSQYIRKSPKLKVFNDLLEKDDRYKSIRNRCNDHTHYNFYRVVLLNDNEIALPDRIKHLEILLNDLDDIFIQHFILIFSINSHYMMASDYVDSLELGLIPTEDSQYWVANIIQDAYNKIIKIKRFDLAEEFLKSSIMKLK